MIAVGSFAQDFQEEIHFGRSPDHDLVSANRESHDGRAGQAWEGTFPGNLHSRRNSFSAGWGRRKSSARNPRCYVSEVPSGVYPTNSGLVKAENSQLGEFR